MAARKKRAKKKKAVQAEVDDILDEILDAPQEELENESIEEEQEPVFTAGDEEQEPNTEDLPFGDEPPVEEREEAGELESSGDDDAQESESDDSPPANEDDKDKARKLTREEGLIKEIQALRTKLNTPHSTPPAAPQAPPAAITTAPPVDQRVPGRVDVLVSEDGQSVYTDPESMRSEIERVAREIVAQASQPTKEQIMAAENQHAVTNFIAADPERNQHIANRMKQADDLITLQVQNLMAEGYKFPTMQQATQTMRELGIASKVIEHFPELENMFEEFIEGSASGNATWRRGLLDRFGSSGATPPSNNPTPKVDLSKTPRSMTRIGGSRTDNSTQSTDESEFSYLNAEFEKETILFPEDKYQRLLKLGAKLEKPGFG